MDPRSPILSTDLLQCEFDHALLCPSFLTSGGRSLSIKTSSNLTIEREEVIRSEAKAIRVYEAPRRVGVSRSKRRPGAKRRVVVSSPSKRGSKEALFTEASISLPTRTMSKEARLSIWVVGQLQQGENHHDPGQPVRDRIGRDRKNPLLPRKESSWSFELRKWSFSLKALSYLFFCHGKARGARSSYFSSYSFETARCSETGDLDRSSKTGQ